MHDRSTPRDDSHPTLRLVDWRAVFPFARLFDAFRVAMHPAKLGLALAAILLVYTVGRAVDGVWPERYSAVADEVSLYENTASRAGFRDAVAEQRRQLDAARAGVVAELNESPGPKLANDASYGQVRDRLVARRDDSVKVARDAFDGAMKLAPAGGEPAAVAARDTIRRFRDNAIAAAYAEAADANRTLEAARGRGVFATFIDYESARIDNVANGVLRFDWTGPAGVFESLRRFALVGPLWAFSAHPLHAAILTLAMLFAWSLFGGAIARLAAVQVARDEKLSVSQSLRFSSNKLLSFFAAPVLPMILVGAIALVLALLGLATRIPYGLGTLVSIVIGALFVIVLFIGVLLALALIGTVIGSSLMYPTIAVEGSDAFDAMSRSFSYVFGRPWKTLFYTFVSIVYGAATYLLLRAVVFFTLSLIHGATSAWVPAGDPSATNFGRVWPGPAGFWDLGGNVELFGLSFGQKLALVFLSFWLYLFISLLGAYLLSFFVSAGTIAYYLLRRDVDVTPTDDVYLDPDDAADDSFDALPADLEGNPVSPPPASPAVAAAPSPAVERPTNAVSAPPVEEPKPALDPNTPDGPINPT